MCSSCCCYFLKELLFATTHGTKEASCQCDLSLTSTSTDNTKTDEFCDEHEAVAEAAAAEAETVEATEAPLEESHTPVTESAMWAMDTLPPVELPETTIATNQTDTSIKVEIDHAAAMVAHSPRSASERSNSSSSPGMNESNTTALGDEGEVEVIEIASASAPMDNIGKQRSKSNKMFTCPHPKCKIRLRFSPMIKHVRKHAGEKPYICTLQDCGKEFTHIRDFLMHYRCHLNYRQYDCDICKHKFVYHKSYLTHMFRFHPSIVQNPS